MFKKKYKKKTYSGQQKFRAPPSPLMKKEMLMVDNVMLCRGVGHSKAAFRILNKYCIGTAAFMKRFSFNELYLSI